MFVVEKHDPHAERPDLSDERAICTGPFAAASRVEDLLGERVTFADVAAALQAGGGYRHVDEETGVEVTGRRMGVAVA